MAEFVQMKDCVTAEDKAAAMNAIALRSQSRHLTNMGLSRGALLVAKQRESAESIGGVTSRFRKQAERGTFEHRESRKVTKGRQKVKGSTIQPDGWYKSSQGADSVVGRDENKRTKAVTTQGVFVNGKNKGFM